MPLPPKSTWKARASQGPALLAIDSSYITLWESGEGSGHWLEVDLGEVAEIGGLELYWGRRCAWRYDILASADGTTWETLAAIRRGEGGLNIVSFPPASVRYLKIVDCNPERTSIELVQLNVYEPDDCAATTNPDHQAALAGRPVVLQTGDVVDVDLGASRYTIGVLYQWGETFANEMEVFLSDDGVEWREVGRIVAGNGDYDSFYWRATYTRYVRMVLTQASSHAGASLVEIKLRVPNKDRMPVGVLEKAAAEVRLGLYPCSLKGEQVFWTALGLPGVPEEALFDEYGNLECVAGGPQLMPYLRIGETLTGPLDAARVDCSLAEGSLPIPTVTWNTATLTMTATAFGDTDTTVARYRVTNHSSVNVTTSLVLAVRPVQINPFWQGGGFTPIREIEVVENQVRVNGELLFEASASPASVGIAEFDGHDVVPKMADGPLVTRSHANSDGAMLSAGLEYAMNLAPEQSGEVVVVAPTRPGALVKRGWDFEIRVEAAIRRWREKIGPRRIEVGNQEVGDAVEAQTGLILVNATQFALKPGPRNYDRTWIRDGSSQALALAYAGLLEEAKTYVSWYAERIYPNGMVPPILNKDGSVNLGYGSDIEFDAQGQFVIIAAEVYRLTRDRAFLDAIFPKLRAAMAFTLELVARTNAIHPASSRFHGLLAPSISHEGYPKPSYSFWDGYFALRGWRDLVFLANERQDQVTAAWATTEGARFGSDLQRAIVRTIEECGLAFIPGSADREDFDPTSVAIAFEPCEVADVLPADFLQATYDRYAADLAKRAVPEWDGSFTPYELRNLNALIALGRNEEAFEMLHNALDWMRPRGYRHWAEVVYGRMRAPEYIGDMPHTWIGAEFATAVRRMLVKESGETLRLFQAIPECWFGGHGITLNDLPTHFGALHLTARRREGTVAITMNLSRPETLRDVEVTVRGAKAFLCEGKRYEAVNGRATLPLFTHVETCS